MLREPETLLTRVYYFLNDNISVFVKASFIVRPSFKSGLYSPPIPES
jgi:hypothetical protein